MTIKLAKRDIPVIEGSPLNWRQTIVPAMVSPSSRWAFYRNYTGRVTVVHAITGYALRTHLSMRQARHMIEILETIDTPELDMLEHGANIFEAKKDRLILQDLYRTRNAVWRSLEGRIS